VAIVRALDCTSWRGAPFKRVKKTRCSFTERLGQMTSNWAQFPMRANTAKRSTPTKNELFREQDERSYKSSEHTYQHHTRRSIQGHSKRREPRPEFSVPLSCPTVKRFFNLKGEENATTASMKTTTTTTKWKMNRTAPFFPSRPMTSPFGTCKSSDYDRSRSETGALKKTVLRTSSATLGGTLPIAG
jgi:hypothetical protein